jgi:hypothetical protein
MRQGAVLIEIDCLTPWFSDAFQSTCAMLDWLGLAFDA